TMIPNFLSTPSAPNSNNCFIVVGDNGTIITSTSGAGWAKQTSGVDNNLYDIAWSEDGIFAVGAGGTILKSLDRITWEPVVSNTSNTLRSIIYVPDDSSVDPEGHASPGTFIVVGDSGTILRSTDGGETWNNLAPFGVSSAASASFTSVAYGDGMFVAVGPSAFVAYSEDGETWTPYSAAPFNSIAYG